MAASVTSPADVANLALKRLGYRLRVGSLLDGSFASSMFLDIYGQTRDAMIADGNWGFAQRQVNGTLLKSAPDGGYFDNAWDPATYPPMGWRYSYTYPTDCLRVRSVRPQPGFLLNMEPTPTLFDTVNDAGYTPPRRVIVANTPNALIVYAAQVTDPSQWTPSFVEAFAAGLARRLAPVLANLNVVPVEAQDEVASTAIAEVTQG